MEGTLIIWMNVYLYLLMMMPDGEEASLSGSYPCQGCNGSATTGLFPITTLIQTTILFRFIRGSLCYEGIIVNNVVATVHMSTEPMRTQK
jgi:hypothetical protein